MNVLDTIIEFKRQEVAKKKTFYPEELFKNDFFFDAETISLKENLLADGASGIIAEFKRKSPSKGDINASANIGEVTQGYRLAGASGLSVLTDKRFFGGENDDVTKTRRLNRFPILRKDFIIDKYQIAEAKAIGASVILLIAAVLSEKEIEDLTEYAKTLNLEVLLEIHSKDEIRKISPLVDLVGVNNRNLSNFTVNIEQSIELSDLIQPEFVKISESGISKPEDVILLKKYGYKGFLIGENFMRQENPATACAEFIRNINAKTQIET